jgi:hypothetical protein
MELTGFGEIQRIRPGLNFAIQLVSVEFAQIHREIGKIQLQNSDSTGSEC